MNLLLLDPQELVDSEAGIPPWPGATGQSPLTHLARLSGTRAKHVIQVLRARTGDSLQVGIVDGRIGRATLASVDAISGSLVLALSPAQFQVTPPGALACRVFIALPRPKAARRMLRMLAECGVKDLHFFNCFKVEKSYWSSPELQASRVQEQFELGLSQAVDTVMPRLTLHRLFKPFVEDSLPLLAYRAPLLLADIDGDCDLASALQGSDARPVNLVIGPEGGLTGYERGKLLECGARRISLGRRTYSSPHALALLLGQIIALSC